MKIDDLMKTILLTGIGAVATTYEKAKEIVEELVAKGKISLEEGKGLLAELKNKGAETLEQFTKDVKKDSE